MPTNPPYKEKRNVSERLELMKNNIAKSGKVIISGSRIEIGGDMFEDHQKFLTWAAAYDCGDIHMRSKAKHDEWQKILKCKQIILDGSANVEDNFEVIKPYL